MIAVTYSYPPDYAMASMVARSLKAAGVSPSLAIDQADPRLHVDGVPVVRTTFDRMRNLNGRDFILGNLRLLHELGQGSEWVMKADSDTLVLSLDFLTGCDGVAVGIHTGQLQGCCYAIRHSALPAMIELGETTLPKGWIMEDQFTGFLAEKVGKVHFRVPGNTHTYFAHWKGETPAEIRERRISVLNFKLKQGRTRRDIAKAMQAFIP